MRTAKRAKVSIARIADMCGLSKMTVSRAIRNDPNVSAATRQLVLRVAERENYLPSGYGSGRIDSALLTRQYHVLFQKQAALQDVFFCEVIRSIQQELFSQGKNCSLGIIGDDYAEFMKLYDMLQTSNVGGILIVGPVASECVNLLLERFDNIVLVDNPGSPELIRPCGAVFFENYYGSLLATRHLLKHGRRNILLVCGSAGNYFTQSLADGYVAALKEAGIEVDPRIILHGDFHIEGGYEATKDAIASGAEFDAVFSNDEMACGAMRAIHEVGMHVPRDVAIVGFDNLPIGQAVRPTLTTVAVDRQRMGKRAVELLLRLSTEEDAGGVSERIGFMPELVVRDSCGSQHSGGE